MTVQVSYPGVYIEEFAPGAPIQGIGTSTAAFLGPAASGDAPLNQPIRITSWDEFRKKFGDNPLAGYYLWYAVRGFFENGGQNCYVVRVSNAAFDKLVLHDQSGASGKPTIELRALKAGVSSPQTQVQVNGDVHAVSAAKLYRPTATLVSGSGTTLTVGTAEEAAHFRPDDAITWDGISETQPVIVSRTEGANLRLTQPLSNRYSSGTIRLADLKRGDKVLRVEGVNDPAKLGSGSVIKLTQGSQEDICTVKQVDVERISSTLTTCRVTLRSGLEVGFSLTDDTSVESEEFTLTVTPVGGKLKTYPELGMDPEHPRYFASVVNLDPDRLITAQPVEPPNTSSVPTNRPATLDTTTLTGGQNDNPANLVPSDYTQALALLEAIRDINIVAIPDRTDSQVHLALADHCKRLYNRFAILDSQRGAPLFGTGSVEVQRKGLGDGKGFAALYYPWIYVSPAIGKEPLLVPPSGHIAGIYARIDNTRGVHKAPAGNEAVVSGALGVETDMKDPDQGIVNLQGINIIRVFSTGGRPVVWGARTIATGVDNNWQYVNIRRLFIYLEQSIEEGIRWAVFEPNNLALWQKLKRTISEFLTRVWRDGALFGATAEQAFYVRIDEALNPPSTLALGRLYIEIGIRPTYPAEFIIVRIGIWQGGSETSEG